MVPRVPSIVVQRPSTSSVPDDFALLGTGTDVEGASSESPRQRQYHEANAEPLGELEDRFWGGVGLPNGNGHGGKSSQRMKWWKVYLLHFMFMWNSRTFEYVSIFLVHSAFPNALTAVSIRGITSTVSSLLCAPAVGNWVDHSPSRLRTLVVTICLNHAAIFISYFCWLFWPIIIGAADELPTDPFSTFKSAILFSIILVLDIIHDLSYIGNRLSLERDWVPLLVGTITPDISYGLTQVNAVMSRIELICKLIAPSLLPIVISSLGSRGGYIVSLAIVTVVLWVFEIWCARIIARDNPEIRAPKVSSAEIAIAESLFIKEEYDDVRPCVFFLPRKLHRVLYRDPARRLAQFFSIPMWPASVSLSLLQLTVLAYGATLITYSMEIGFTLASVTAAKASGSITGLASTVITPWLVNSLRKRHLHARDADSDDEDAGDGSAVEGEIVRTVGVWGITSQFVCMIPVVLVLWGLSPPPPHGATSRDPSPDSEAGSFNILIPISLFGFLSLSRVGHLMISLMVQELGQTEIPAAQRSTFAGTEQSFQSACELTHYAATVVFSQPSQFKWLAMGSMVTVGAGAVIFGTWSRKSRARPSEGYEGIPMLDVGREDGED